jgi:lipoprotein-anchoring transpeptidase ErfK/SrfK
MGTQEGTSGHIRKTRLHSPLDRPAKKIVISIARQNLVAFNGEEKCLDLSCITGDAKHPTPTGKFRILEKELVHRSKKYNAQMNYAMRLNSTGIYIHEAYNVIEDPAKQTPLATAVSDTAANIVSKGRQLFPTMAESTIALGNINLLGSHGCIRLPHSGAVELFEWAKKGTRVEIQ